MNTNEKSVTVKYEHIANKEMNRNGISLIVEHVEDITILRDSSFEDREEITVKVNGKEIYGWITDK